MTRFLICNPQQKFDPSDFEGYEIITPNKHAARSLNVPENSLEAIALKTIARADLRVASPLVSYQTLREAARIVYGADESEKAARSLKSSVQTLIRTNLDLTVFLPDEAEKIHNLSKVTNVYLEKLHDKGLIDSAEILWKGIECKPQKRIVYVHGYYRPRIDELAFIDSISADKSIFNLPSTDDAVFRENQDAVLFLNQKGWSTENSLFKSSFEESKATTGERLSQDFISGNPDSDQKGTSVIYYPNLEAEVRGVLSQLKNKLVNGVSPDQIGLIVRDDSIYGPIVSAISWEYQIPVRVLYDVPLSDTRLGNWIYLLLDAILNNLPFETTARLLAQYLGPGISDGEWKQAREQRPSGKQRWKTLGIDLEPLVGLPEKNTRGKWSEFFEDLLEGFEIQQKVGFWSREILAFYTLKNELASFYESAEEVIKLETFVSEIKQLLAITSVPAQPGRGGIELHTPITAAGARHEHLFVMGMCEGIFPSPAKEDLVFDFHERKKLSQAGFNIETAAISARREALLFYATLLTGTQTVTLTYSCQMNGRETLPSPFISRLSGKNIQPQNSLDIQSFVSSVEELYKVHLLDEGAPSEHVLEKARNAYAVEEGRESSLLCDEYDGNTGMPFDAGQHEWSVTELERLAQCPFRWFGEYVLGLSEASEIGDEISPDIKGRFYHQVLELAVRPVSGVNGHNFTSEEARKIISDELLNSFARVEKELKMDHFLGWRAQREEHFRILQRAVNSEEFIKNGATIWGPELKFTGSWEGFNITGRLDRVDKGQNGLVIVDYKSGAGLSPGAKDSEGKAKLNIQLPIYSEVIINSGAVSNETKVDSAYYFSLSKGKVIKSPGNFEASEKSELITRIKKILDEGRFAVEPDSERKACLYCDLDLVCRKSGRLERKGNNNDGK